MATGFDKFQDLTDGFETNKYTVDVDGIHCPKGNSKNTYDERICAIPIFPIAYFHNKSTDIRKIQLAYVMNGRCITRVVDSQSLASQNAIVRLSDYGIPISTYNAKDMVEYFSRVTGDNPLIPVHDTLSTMGWTDDEYTEFLPYTDTVEFDGMAENKSLYDALKCKGDFETWKSHMLDYRKYSLEVRLCMAAAFASPLTAIVGENPFVFHLWGTTGGGKTVTLMVAASIWGNPDRNKLLRSMNGTTNAIMNAAAFYNDIPFFGDELQTIKTTWKNYDKLIMQVTEGMDRQKMLDGTHSKESKPWRCAFIFSGEEPCTKASSGGGTKNRVIEVHYDKDLVTDGNETANFVRQNYGFAGKEFIKALPDHATINKAYQEISRMLLETGTTDKQAGTMALMMVADKLASNLFWKGEEEPLKVADVAQYLKDPSEVDTSERAFQYLCDSIYQHSKYFTTEGYEQWGVIEGNTAYILVKVAREILNESEFDFDAVKQKWADRGHLVKGNGRFTVMKRLRSDGTPTSAIKIILPEVDRDNEDDEEGDLPFAL